MSLLEACRIRWCYYTANTERAKKKKKNTFLKSLSKATVSEGFHRALPVKMYFFIDTVARGDDAKIDQDGAAHFGATCPRDTA